MNWQLPNIQTFLMRSVVTFKNKHFRAQVILYGITNSGDMSLSKLQQIVKDREAWCAPSPWGGKELDTYERTNSVHTVRAHGLLQCSQKMSQGLSSGLCLEGYHENHYVIQWIDFMMGQKIMPEICQASDLLSGSESERISFLKSAHI